MPYFCGLTVETASVIYKSCRRGFPSPEGISSTTAGPLLLATCLLQTWPFCDHNPRSLLSLAEDIPYPSLLPKKIVLKMWLFSPAFKYDSLPYNEQGENGGNRRTARLLGHTAPPNRGWEKSRGRARKSWCRLPVAIAIWHMLFNWFGLHHLKCQPNTQ